MNIQSNKKIKLACMATVIASSLITSSANAVTPDQQFALSGVWTHAKLLKSVLVWEAALGWGSAGLSNVVISKLMGASEGAMTRAAFSGVCGTVAAGSLAHWKPKAEPTTASSMKAVMKAGGVAHAALHCGWVTQVVYDKMNNEIPKAERFINNTATPTEKRNITNTKSEANNELLTLESIAKASARAYNEGTDLWKSYQANCGGSHDASPYCQNIINKFGEKTTEYNRLQAQYNAHGKQLAGDLQRINRQIRS